MFYLNSKSLDELTWNRVDEQDSEEYNTDEQLCVFFIQKEKLEPNDVIVTQ